MDADEIWLICHGSVDFVQHTLDALPASLASAVANLRASGETVLHVRTHSSDASDGYLVETERFIRSCAAGAIEDFWKTTINSVAYANYVVLGIEELADADDQERASFSIGGCSTTMSHMNETGTAFTTEDEAVAFDRLQTALRATCPSMPEYIVERAREKGLSRNVTACHFRMNMKGRIHVNDSPSGVARDSFTHQIFDGYGAAREMLGEMRAGSTGLYLVLLRLMDAVGSVQDLEQVIPSVPLINNLSVLCHILIYTVTSWGISDQVASQLRHSGDKKLLVETDFVTFAPHPIRTNINIVHKSQ